MSARHRQRAAADDNQRPFGALERIERRLGQFRDERGVVAEPFDLVGLVGRRSDAERLRTLLPHRLAKPVAETRPSSNPRPFAQRSAKRAMRSEARRGGKECGRKVWFRWTPSHQKKN